MKLEQLEKYDLGSKTLLLLLLISFILIPIEFYKDFITGLLVGFVTTFWYLNKKLE